MQSADINEIYNLLFAGKRLQLSFDSVKEAEYFRIRFATFKSRQESSLLSAGFMEEEDIPAFSFIRADKQTNIWTLTFRPRRAPASYKILVLDDE